MERTSELDPAVVVEAVVTVPEHLHVGLTEHRAGIRDEVQGTGDAQSLVVAGADQEGAVPQPLHEQVQIACDIPPPGGRELQREVIVDLVWPRPGRGRFRGAHESAGYEIGELGSHEGVVGCATSFLDLAVARLGEPVPLAIQSDSSDISARCFEPVDLVVAKSDEASQPVVDLDLFVATEREAHDLPRIGDTEQDHPAVGVGERHSCLGDSIEWDAFLEFDALALGRELLGELFGAEVLDRRPGTCGVKERV